MASAQRKLAQAQADISDKSYKQARMQAEQAELDARLEAIKLGGIPNYFGAQRFGHEGGNVGEARHYAERQALPEQRNVRSRSAIMRVAEKLT